MSTNALSAPSAVMTTISDLADLVAVQDEATVSRTVLTVDGARVVVFAFAAGQVLTEHTAAMPVLLTAVEGELLVTADGRTDTLVPGGVIHFDTRLPHAIEAVTDAKLVLTMIDARKVSSLPAHGDDACGGDDGCGGRENLLGGPAVCECGHDDGTEPHIDARLLPGLVRHPAIIGAFQSLRPGQSLIVTAGHAPMHLLDQLAEITPFEWEFVQQGPVDWKVRLTRPEEAEAEADAEEA